MKQMQPVLLIPMLAVFAGSAAGQTGNWVRPNSGALFDPPTNSLRLIEGYPGGAVLSVPILSELRFGLVSPDGRRAVVQDGEKRVLWAELSPTPDTSEIFLPAGASPIAGLRWSSDSKQLFVYDAANRQFMSCSRDEGGNVPLSTPQFQMDESAGVLLDFTVRGDRLLAVTSQGLFLIERHGSTYQLLDQSGPRFLLDGAGGAWAVHDELGRISRLAIGPRRRVRMAVLIDDPERLSNVRSVTLAGNASILAVADRSTSTLYGINIASGIIETELPIPAGDSALTPISPGRWLIKVRENADEPAWIVDDSAGLRVLFIPGGPVQ